MQGKTIYFLGAGFAKEAGYPIQQEILQSILLKYEHQTHASFELFKRLCKACNLIPIDTLDDQYLQSINIETIFTTIDKCIRDNRSIKFLGIEELNQIKLFLCKEIAEAVTNHQRDDSSYIDDFAEYIVDEVSHAKYNKTYAMRAQLDPIAVITTNWDTSLDQALYKAIKQKKNKLPDPICHDPERISDKGIIDYCCHLNSANPNQHNIIPGLEALALGGYNVKLLKIHGSKNWLQCASCDNLFIDLEGTRENECRFCHENYGQSTEEKYPLEHRLIMPTYLKNINNLQFQMIWHNAAIELSEADKIVFIGYSLPETDFEIKQILIRMIKSNVKIEVVDLVEQECDKFQLQHKWHSFLARAPQAINFHMQGAKQYIDHIIMQSSSS